MTDAPTALDDMTLAISWRRLLAYVDEATVTLLRCAFSRVVTDAGDFSCALFDRAGRMVVQPSQGLPVFIGCLCTTLADFVASIPEQSLRSGDSYIMNDPWRCTGQINDLTLITPLFYRGALLGFAANVAHASDLGGRVLSADSKDMYEEGLRLPLMRAFIRHRPNPDLFELIRLNSRVPDIVLGDLQAQLSANRILGRRLCEFLEESPQLDFARLADALFRRAEAAMRLAIKQLPDGRYEAEVFTDGFDEQIRLAAEVEIRGDEIFVDYTGTSAQASRGINCCLNYAIAETVFPLICVARPGGLINGGSLRPLHVSAPPGCLLNPAAPAPLGARAIVSQFLQAVVFRALALAVPDRVLADCGTPAWLPVLAGRNQAGNAFVEMMFLNGGFGAGSGRDGISCLGWPASFSGTPVEFTESEKPILIRRKELVPDSGGAGRFRGGLGQVWEWESRAGHDLTLALRGDRVAHPPLGLLGGGPGTPSRILRNGQPIHAKKTIAVEPGDVILLETPGSGGFGRPDERSAQSIAADVRNGYVTRAAAERLYGPSLALDGGSDTEAKP